MIPKSIADWFAPNRTFYNDFRQWLRDGGYGDSSLRLYSMAARFALGTLAGALFAWIYNRIVALRN